MFFLNPHKLYSQLRDGTNCGKAVILPLPAETCNRREFQIREKEMWFEFHGSGTEVSLKLSPGAQNPVNELTEAILYRERGGCPNLEEIKKEHIGRLENERRINFERLEHGVNYKLKLVREVRIPENFEMCLMREKQIMLSPVYLCNSINNLCYQNEYNYDDNVSYCKLRDLTEGENLNISEIVKWGAVSQGARDVLPCINTKHDHFRDAQYIDRYYFKGTVSIEPKGELNINGITLFFSPESEILVKANFTQNNLHGGRLTIDNGAVFTASGTACMWKGIKVEGVRKRGTDGKDYQLSGECNITGSRVEDAHIGVLIKETIVAGQSHPGGIIIANNSIFLNNNQGIVFQKYSAASVDKNSSIYECTFVNDRFLKDVNTYGSNQYSLNFIELNNFRKENESSYLLNTNTFYTNQAYPRTTGVLAFSSDFNAGGNTFENLRTGINSQDFLQGSSWKCKFISNKFKGKFVYGMAVISGRVYIKNNTFTETANGKASVAILLENCADANVLENTINSATSAGILSLNANTPLANKIQKNTIYNTETAIGMGGDNNNTFINCNKFNNHTVAGISIYGYMNLNGFVSEQGHCEDDPEKNYPSGNKFFPFQDETSVALDIISEPSASKFTYWYDEASSNIPEIVPDYDDNATNIEVNGCLTIITSDQYCLALQPAIRPNNNQRIAHAEFLSDTLMGDFEDETVENINLEELIPQLKEQNTKEARKLLVSILISQRKIAEARAEIAQINTLENEDYYFLKYYNLLCLLQEQGKDLWEMDSNQVALIREIEASKTTLRANARVVLSYIFGEEFPLDCEMLGSCEENERKIRQSKTNLKEDKLFVIIPNPVKDEAKVIINLQNDFINAELYIHDLSGKKLISHTLKNNASGTIINTKVLPNGIYTCWLQIAGNEKHYQKLVIIR